jgi:hypothetical protein
MSSDERPSIGRIVGSVSFILGWAVLHYLLFFLLAGSGVVLEVLLSIVKTFLFPGRSLHEQHLDITAWSTSLTVGVVIAGLAGIPAGLAILWRDRRKVMMRMFWIAFIAGIAFELYALISFIGSALTA